MCFTNKRKKNWILKGDRVSDLVRPPGRVGYGGVGHHSSCIYRNLRYTFREIHPLDVSLRLWVESSPLEQPKPIIQHLPLAHDGLVLFQTSSQQLKQRVLFIQMNGSCDLKHIGGGSSNTNLSLGHIGDSNLIRVR